MSIDHVPAAGLLSLTAGNKIPRARAASVVNKDFTSKAKTKIRDLALEAKANDFKTVLKDSSRTRPRTNYTEIV